MGQRRYERFKQDARVKISGTDNFNNPFSQTAAVIDVSHGGVRLDGVGMLDRPGSIVTLEHRGSQAKYRVIWIGEEKLTGQAGLMLLDPQRPIFGKLPTSAPDRFAAPASAKATFEDGLRKRMEERRKAERRQEERRRYRRYACPGEVDLYSRGMEHPDRGRLTDLSLGGCFVELMSPIAMDTEVNFVMRIAQCEIRGKGIVKSTMPQFGVGIRFLHFEESQMQQMDAVIATLEQGRPVRETKRVTQPQAESSSGPGEAQNLKNELLSWFGNNESLSRQQFFELLKKHTT